MFDDIALFVHIVRRQGLAAAAKALNLPPATVTRRLQKLEETLGCQLLHRSARKFALTTEGESYYQAYSDLVQEFEQTAQRLSSDIHLPHGRLRVSAPTNISIGFLQPMWSGFIKEHPDIQLDLHLNNQITDLLNGQIDIALRVGPQPDSQLFQQRLGSVATVLVASPGYLSTYGQPETLSDLENHRIIANRHFLPWRLQMPENDQQEIIYPTATTQVDDLHLAAQFAVDDLGITILPVIEVHAHLEEGRLQRVLSPWYGPRRDLFAIWPSGRLLNAKAKCLREYMQRYMSGFPILQGYY
ncbi:LysR family transcriptional regulator [Aestuariispira ectoiniformans]|uniref:LysR family transcriptional regulator n=1 Tax=Aestuariispira ectoiniformans TaxID=2775080 RepID=UPI00223C18AA|nr:LysR family transcriptional regulator [Aestuariispira ectoiniformans]